MKIFTKISILFLILVFVVATGASCSCIRTQETQKKITSEDVKLVFWEVSDDSRVYDQIIENYQKKNSNVEIEVVQKDENTYEIELINALAAGNGPDIAQIRNNWLPRHIDKLIPAVQDVEGAITEEKFKEFFVDVAASQLISDGKIYGIPLSVDTLALYYRKDIIFERVNGQRINQVPNNWTDLLPIVKALTAKDNRGRITRSGLAMGTGGTVSYSDDILALLMLQNNTKMVSDDFRGAAFNTSETKATGQLFYPGTEALNFYTSFANPRTDRYTWNKNLGNPIDAFISGKAKMVFGYSSLVRTLANKAPTLEYNIAPFPQVKNAKEFKYYPRYWAQVVTNNAEHPDVAWDFLAYLSSINGGGGYSSYLNKSSKPSAVKETYTGVEREEQNRVRRLIGGIVFFRQAQDAVDYYKGKYPERVDQSFVEMIDAVVLRGQTLQSAIDTASTEVTELLQE